MESSSQEAAALKRIARDAVAISELSSTWIHRQPEQVALSLVEVLAQSLSLEFSYVFATDSDDHVESVYGKGRALEAEELEKISSFLRELVQSKKLVATVLNPLGVGSVQLSVTPIGLNCKNGYLVAASRRTEFPLEHETALMNVATAQAFTSVRYKWELQRSDKLRKQVEASKFAVENERENFRNLFKQTPEMVCILKGPEHLFEFVNEAHVRALGFDATGKTVRVAQPESVEVHGILDNVFTTGVTAELHEIPVTLGKQLRYFNLTYSARKDLSGEINGVMILGIEVTNDVLARKELQEGEERLRFALSAGAMGTWIVDLKTSGVTMSEESLQLFGLPLPKDGEDADVDQIIDAVIHVDDRERAKKELEEAVATSALYRSEYKIVRPSDGELRWILATGRAGTDGTDSPVFFSGIIMDITERKNYEAELEVAKDEAERANQLKSAFLANMSHEIRTPLGAMLGFADLLRDPGLTASERSNYIGILTRNGEQLSGLINDILDLSKVEAGHLTLEFIDTDAHQITTDVLSLMRVKALEKGLTLVHSSESSESGIAVSDPLRVRQVLLNLVSNAIKFTPAGQVKVRSYTRESKTGATRVYFEIEDTGIGIHHSQLERVFDVFVQADGSMTRKFGGTGLGLALSRRLARALGGDVTILRTAEGKGATFQFYFEDQPSRRNSESTVNKEEHVHNVELLQNALEGIRVLVVDDAPDNQQLFYRYLTKRGATVESAENGMEGYRKALAGNFDVVLMDIQMPTMDGYTATEKLRSAGYRKPIIALTAHAMTEVRKKCLNIGCTDYISKPIDQKTLITSIVRNTRPEAI